MTESVFNRKCHLVLDAIRDRYGRVKGLAVVLAPEDRAALLQSFDGPMQFIRGPWTSMTYRFGSSELDVKTSTSVPRGDVKVVVEVTV